MDFQCFDCVLLLPKNCVFLIADSAKSTKRHCRRLVGSTSSVNNTIESSMDDVETTMGAANPESDASE